MISDRHNSQECSSSSKIEIQEPWLQQSYLIGHPLEQRDDYAGALAAYNRVLDRYPKYLLVLLLKGRALLNLEREEEAQEIFHQVVQDVEQALQEHPENTQLWVYKGDALCMLAIKGAALDAYNQTIGLSPNDPEAYINKGWLLFH